MTKAFSVASWNIEHFKGDQNRMERVFKFLTENPKFSTPDVFGIYEVVGKSVYETLTTLLPEKNAFFPKEWDYIYQKQLPNEPVKEALQESGVVLMDKEKHKESIQFIYDLNNNHKETYNYIWGDKETFWIGCVMAGKEFYFNPTSGYISKETGKLSHDYNGSIFFSQKGEF